MSISQVSNTDWQLQQAQAAAAASASGSLFPDSPSSGATTGGSFEDFLSSLTQGSGATDPTAGNSAEQMIASLLQELQGVTQGDASASAQGETTAQQGTALGVASTGQPASSTSDATSPNAADAASQELATLGGAAQQLLQQALGAYATASGAGLALSAASLVV